MSQEFDWDSYISERVDGAKAVVLESVIAHVLSLDERDLKNQGWEAINRTSKTICHTPVALHLLVKYAPDAHQN